MDFSGQNQELVLKKLVERGLVSSFQLEELKVAAQKDGISVLDLISERRIVTDEDIIKLKSEVLDIPYIDLSDKKIKPEILNTIPREIAENYKIVPWQKISNELSVGLANPEDYKAVEALDFLARQNSFKIKYYVISSASLKTVLRQYETLSQEVEQVLGDTKKNDDVLLEEDGAENRETEESYKSAPISKVVSVILRHAVEGKASDVHIEPVGDQSRVRFRLDGALHTSIILPRSLQNAIVARIKVLANLKLDETRLPQDGRFSMKFENKKIDFRVSTLPLAEEEKVTMRILDTESAAYGLEELGFSSRNLELMKRYVGFAHGMFLVTGPTGSGKTTTLYTLLGLLNKESVNIVTLEDPIEYYLQGISQSQINPQVGFSFANGLRSILRQDPDIIMVGEIRDNETAELSVHASLTGHKVLSTLHTNDALGTISRLMDMGIEPFLIASSLKMALAQRLIRKNCERCKKEIPLPDGLREEALKELAKVPKKYLDKNIDLANLKSYRGEGCPHCENSGYRGRIAIAETIEVTRNFEKIISSGELSNKDKVQEELSLQGMFPMKADGFIKAALGLTTFEEVVNATQQ